jgi:hypothetical protein
VLPFKTHFAAAKNIFMKLIYTLFVATIVCTSSACSKFGDSSAAGGGEVSGKGGSMARFTIYNGFMYTVDATTLTTYNLSNPANPSLTSQQNIGFEIETIFPFNGKLFIGSTSVIHIFDLADPAKPAKLSEAISPTVMRRCDPVVAKDSVAYATLRTTAACGNTQSILAVFDIKNIRQPIQKTTLPLQSPNGLGYADTALYVCDNGTLRMFNIKNAYTPVAQGQPIVNNAIDVIPYYPLLFCQTSNGVLLYNITNLFQPIQLSEIR